MQQVKTGGEGAASHRRRKSTARAGRCSFMSRRLGPGGTMALLGMLLFPGNATAKSAENLRKEIEQALRRSALEGFAGSITFVKEIWAPAMPGEQESVRHSIQEWKTAIDGRGQIRAEVRWPQADFDYPFVSGETRRHLWMAENIEVVALEKGTDPSVVEANPKLRVAQNLVNQARHEIGRLLEAPGHGASAIEILMIERDPDHPSAIVRIDASLRYATFARTNGLLLLESIIYSDEQASYRCFFSDYRCAGRHWIPQGVEFRQHDIHGNALRCIYSQIETVPASDSDKFQEGFAVPKPGDAVGEQRVILVETFSDEGVTSELFGNDEDQR